MNHLMVDLEALRLTKLHKTPLMNIGAVVFDERGKMGEMLDVYIKPELLPEWTEPEKGTVDWWKVQPTWKELNASMSREGVFPEVALSRLNDIYEKNKCETIWYNGPLYDGTILDVYYDRLGYKQPWKYDSVRDLRTIRKQYKDLLDEHHKRTVTTHLALQDSIDQVSILRTITLITGHLWS